MNREFSRKEHREKAVQGAVADRGGSSLRRTRRSRSQSEDDASPSASIRGEE
jgi:hypothetical protein